jgi:predicted DsbA family dithiol-disulfide isomerase
MPTSLTVVAPRPPALVLDLVADFTCPWSFLGTRRIARALLAVQGLASPPVIRWHGFRLPRVQAPASPWRDHLAQRLPAGITVELAERSLEDAGEALGLRFDFARIATVPDTLHAHRLVLLASGEGRQAAVIDALFRAYFEQGRDIGDLQELVSIGAAQGLSPSVLQDLVRVSAGSDNGADLVSDTVVAEELRLRSLGVQNVPNLLLNGHVLVPGPAEVDTYVQALDQVLFPVAGAAEAPPRLH